MSLKIVSSKKEKDIELCFHRLGLTMQALDLKKSTTFPRKTPMTKTASYKSIIEESRGGGEYQTKDDERDGQNHHEVGLEGKMRAFNLKLLVHMI